MRIALGCGIALAISGCGPSSSNDRPPSITSEQAPVADPSNPRAQPQAPAQREARASLFAAVDAMIANCEIDVQLCTVSRCADDEQRQFLELYADDSRPRAPLLDAWAELLVSDDAARATVGAYVVGGLMRSLSLDGSRPIVPRSTATALIASLADLPRFHAARSVMGVTHAAALAGELDALLAAAASHTHDEALLPIIYGSMLRYARLTGFPTLQLALKQGVTPRTAAAIMSAPRALVDATPSERTTLCEWVRPFIAEPRPSVANEAANTMMWCGGAFIDALLDHAATQVEAGTMDKNLTIPLRGICASSRGARARGSEAQCARNLQILESAVLNPELSEGARVQALVSVHRQRPDEATLKLAKRAQRQPQEQLRFRATAIVKSLTSPRP
jgi:hypothetical protein